MNLNGYSDEPKQMPDLPSGLLGRRAENSSKRECTGATCTLGAHVLLQFTRPLYAAGP